MKKKIALALTGLLILSILLTAPFYVEKPAAYGPEPPEQWPAGLLDWPLHLHGPCMFSRTSPQGTILHELHPTYCNKYTLTAWYDKNEDGKLSRCDWVALNTTMEYSVADVTATLELKKGTDTMFLEFDGTTRAVSALDEFLGLGRNVVYKTVPRGEVQWHEVWPVFSNIRRVIGWRDKDTPTPSRSLTAGDEVSFVSGEWWTVNSICTDLILTKFHWKIAFAQKNCDAFIVGNLTKLGAYIPGSDFELNCTQDFVFWKVYTDVIPTDIDFVVYINWDKEPTGIPPYGWDDIQPHVIEYPEFQPYHFVWVKNGTLKPPEGVHKLVVVEVQEEKYDYDRPYFEWQVTLTAQNCTGAITKRAAVTGNLTREDTYIPGTAFSIDVGPNYLPPIALPTPMGQPQRWYNFTRRMACTVVKTPWCVVPNDIHFTLWMDWDEDGVRDLPGEVQTVPDIITQYPYVYKWTQTCMGTATIEVTEVQMWRYIWMGNQTIWDHDLGTFNATIRQVAATPPYRFMSNTTITQPDPITGIAKLSIPPDGFFGTNYTWYDIPTALWTIWAIRTNEQGYGWTFTGEGVAPVFGDVDTYTMANQTGNYWLSPSPKAGQKAAEPGGVPGVGPDGIPGTGDDGFGNKVADPAGSSVTIIPSYLTVYIYNTGATRWETLFRTPWPMVMTTATAYAKIWKTTLGGWEQINGTSYINTGKPTEFLAGLDHPGWKVNWKHAMSNAYTTYAGVWCMCNVPTWSAITGSQPLDCIYRMDQRVVREDVAIADVDYDEEVKIFDVTKCTSAWKCHDYDFSLENPAWIPHWTASDPGGTVPGKVWDGTVDVAPPRERNQPLPAGKVDIFDVTGITTYWRWKMTPDGLKRAP